MARTVALIAAALVASCAAKAVIVAVEPTIWILPISAKDSEQVCVITMDYPGRRCITAGELRSYVRNVKAN